MLSFNSRDKASGKIIKPSPKSKVQSSYKKSSSPLPNPEANTNISPTESTSNLFLSNADPLKTRFQVTMNRYKLEISDFTRIKKIGDGGFGSVYSAKEKTTGKMYAAKIIENKCSDKETRQNMKYRELSILIKTSHPTIIHFEGFSLKDFRGKNKITIFTELMNCSLANFLQKKWDDGYTSNYNTIRQIILVGIARGMMFLHSHHIMHRDLKPDNVLLDDFYRPKITDFGYSKFYDSQESIENSITGIGTIQYMAPELFRDAYYNNKIDVYAFGVLMYEVVTGKKAYKELLEADDFNAFFFAQKIMNGLRPTFDPSDSINPNFKEMIESCWSRDPKDRPTFEEIFEKLSLRNRNEMNRPLDNCYCFDGVDEDDLFYYIDEISDDKTRIDKNEDEITQLREMVEKSNELLMETIKQQQNKINELIESIDQITTENSNQKKEISLLQEEIKQLKQDYIEQPSKKERIQNQLEIKCREIREKVISGFISIAKLPDFIQKVPAGIFKGCKKLKEVKMPDSVRVIENEAFAECSLLTSVTIPPSVTSIGDRAFSECSSLERIEIPESVEYIGGFSFNECSMLKEVEIPSSVKVIQNSIFYRCWSLESVVIPPSVTLICPGAFNNCTSLKTINIPSSVTEIGYCVFNRCSSLVSLEIPSSVKSIGSAAFNECSSLMNVEIPSSLKEISDNCFSECKSLESVEIPPSVISIGSFAFAGCSSLTSIEIPSSVKEIGDDAFSRCSALTSVMIPSSVFSPRLGIGKNVEIDKYFDLDM